MKRIAYRGDAAMRWLRHRLGNCGEIARGGASVLTSPFPSVVGKQEGFSR